jgi:PEP-CTERM motif
MAIRTRSRRSVLAVAFATVPLSSQASTILNLPSFDCSNGSLQAINFAGDVPLALTGANGTGVVADIYKPPNPNQPASFSCANSLFSTGSQSGDGFSISFGQLPAVQDNYELKYELKLESFDYKLADTSFKIPDLTYSDFNLYLYVDKLEANGGILSEYKDYLGVQVISQFGSALSTDDKWFVDTSGNLIFDPVIPGGSAEIRLLAAPENIPEPATLALVGAGLAGIATGLRRRHKRHKS